VVLSFIFLIIASVIGIFYPIWEARDLFFKVLTGDTFKEFIEKSSHGGSRGGSRCPSCLTLQSSYLLHHRSSLRSKYSEL